MFSSSGGRYARGGGQSHTVFVGMLVATLMSGGATSAAADEPGGFSKSSPTNGATGAPTQGLVLSWAVSSNATTYEWCVDTTNNGACDTSWTSNGSMTYVLFGNNLPGNTTFYWHVRARNATGATESNSGAWWSFTTRLDRPSAFGKRSPSNGGLGQAADPTLSWGATVPGAPSYEYCVDTTNDNSCGTSWTSVASTSAALSGLNSNTTYWWQVRARNMAGTTDADYGTWWSFTTSIAEPACSYIVPTSIAVEAAGSSGFVTVTTSSGCPWTATSNDAWISVTSGSSGSGSGAVGMAVSANPSASARTGTITIAGLTFTISQDGAAPVCAYSISPQKATYPLTGGGGTVNVTTGSGCAWTAVSDTTFVTITSGASGSGPGPVTYSVATSTVGRSSVLTIAGLSFAVTQQAPSTLAAGHRDFDGDARSELVIFRPLNATWYLRYSSAGYGTAAAFQWGLPSDIPVSGDFDGDAKADLTVWRPSNGTWYVRYSSVADGSFGAFQWGLQDDIPLVGDFDGDGKAELTVWRPSNGTWFIRYSSLAYEGVDAFQWGLPGDVPIAADFDGDRKTDLTIWRPSVGTWYIRYSSVGYSLGGSAAVQWGLSGDVPLAGDFDGDGETELAVWRPSNGTWYLRYSSLGYGLGSYGAFQWGLPGDIPICDDFDGDGKTELAVWRPSIGTWYVKYSSLGYSTGSVPAFQWGLPGDQTVK